MILRKEREKNIRTVVNNTPDFAALNALKMALRSCCVNEPCNLKIRHQYYHHFLWSQLN